MPPQVTTIFDGTATLSTPGSDLFDPSGLIYFETPNQSEPTRISVSLKLILANGQPRNIPLSYSKKGCGEFSVFNTDDLIVIPGELALLGLQAQAFVGASPDLDLRIINAWVPTADLNDIKDQLDQIQGTQLIESVIDIVANALSGGIVSEVIGAVAGGAIRGGLGLLNPSTTSPVYLGFENALNLNNYKHVIPPGGSISLPPHQGAIYGFAPSGETINVRAWVLD